MNPVIKKEDYKSYIANYKGSKDEEEDFIDFYKEFKGDMTHILEHIIGSDNSDT
jgi:hypothetical protein